MNEALAYSSVPIGRLAVTGPALQGLPAQSPQGQGGVPGSLNSTSIDLADH